MSRRLAGQEPFPFGLDLAPFGDVAGDGQADARAGMDRDAPVELDVPSVAMVTGSNRARRSRAGLPPQTSPAPMTVNGAT